MAGAPTQLAPTGAALGSSGLRIHGASRSSVLDRGQPVVGMRVQFSTRFHKLDTKVPATASQVKVNLADPKDVRQSVALTEDAEQTGLFTGSFVPTVAGSWRAELVQGAEVMGQSRFHVAQRNITS